MLITILLFFILYMLDQALKFIMLNQGVNNPIVIGGTESNHFIKLELQFNPGAAFSMGSNATVFLTIVSFIATIALIIICTKFNNWKKNKTQAFALTLTLAGCVGNLFDRFLTANGVNFLSTTGKTIPGVNSGVVDMIYFRPFEWICDLLHMGYGVFNLADFYLVTGIILFAFDLIFFSERKKRKWEKSL
ncbi:MAG: signal peptidase II [Acholeplasmatales bacterium]|nr:signal peptidase II [Acholeplasmatales bacterium]